MVSVFNNKKQLWSFLISVVVAVFAVTMIASAITYIDADSVGVATATPGGALAVKGVALVDGFVSANYFTATSSVASWVMGGGLGVGSTSPGAALAVKGGGIFDEFVTTSYLAATSTTATSTFNGGLEADTNTLLINYSGNSIGIATSSFPDLDGDTDPIISVGAGSASSTMYLAGGASVGSSIILKSIDGQGCVVISAGGLQADVDGTISLLGKWGPCPNAE